MKSIKEAAKEFAKKQAILEHKFEDEVDKRKAEHACYKAALQMAEFAQRWIPVEEELPEPLDRNDSGIIDNEDLLLLKYKPFSSLEFGVLRQNKYDTYFELPDIGDVPIDNISHWRPIELKP